MPTQIVQLTDSESTSTLCYPVTSGDAVMIGAQTLIQELSKYMELNEFTELIGGVRCLKASVIPNLPQYLKQGSYSTTSAPYVHEVSVNEAGDKLIVKTWSKATNGVLATDQIDIVGENTTYTFETKYNTETNVNNAPNSAISVTDSDGTTTNLVFPVGALRNDNNVELVLNGNFTDRPTESESE